MRPRLILGVVATMCVVLAAGWFTFRSGAPATGQMSVQGDAVPAKVLPLKPPRVAPSGHIECRNEDYRFSLFYPAGLEVKEIYQSPDTATITFQNVATAQGFQIFIVPYGEQQVSEERVRRDVPSGVRQKPLDVTIDGVTAASFYSSNAMLGDTAEIWFVSGGYLYEVTTLKPLAGWLSQIMMSSEGQG